MIMINQSKSDRERQKLIADKCQTLIEALLKDEDNKYCVDCDAKGPRWASWNLGIFLCIRCAGIHRNLGVHISRVKSVNLDAWSPEHVAYVQRMGNSRARAIYEANLPDDFRRPQTDTALESFIRAKYEHKRYIAHDYVDPGPPEPAFNVEEELKRIKEQKRGKLGSSSSSSGSTTIISRGIKLGQPPLMQKEQPQLLIGMDTTTQPQTLIGIDNTPQLLFEMDSPSPVTTAPSFLGSLQQQQQQQQQQPQPQLQQPSISLASSNAPRPKPNGALADLIDLM